MFLFALSLAGSLGHLAYQYLSKSAYEPALHYAVTAGIGLAGLAFGGLIFRILPFRKFLWLPLAIAIVAGCQWAIMNVL